MPTPSSDRSPLFSPAMLDALRWPPPAKPVAAAPAADRQAVAGDRMLLRNDADAVVQRGETNSEAPA